MTTRYPFATTEQWFARGTGSGESVRQAPICPFATRTGTTTAAGAGEEDELQPTATAQTAETANASEPIKRALCCMG